MIPLSLYSCGDWGGKPHFECNCCARDGFDEAAMQDHIRLLHEYQKGLIEQHEPVSSSFRGRVMLSAIFWQNDETAQDTMTGLLTEALRLKKQGITPYIATVGAETSERYRCWDNALMESCYANNILYSSMRARTNVGSSVMRSRIIDAAKNCECDYVMLTDGDIEIVPYSSMAMIELLESNKRLGCVGAYSNSYSTKREECTTEAPLIPAFLLRAKPFIAWTQYGMFRREVFDTCTFEQGGPFYGPGWGFEDDDMAMQMRANNWEIANFRGMRYLHRNRSSSLKSLQEAGHDPRAMFEARKSFFLAKWHGFSHNVAGMQYPTRP